MDAVNLPPVGGRVRAVRWAPTPDAIMANGQPLDDNDTVPPGTEGTVTRVAPEVGQLGVKWDNGATLHLLLGVDEWEPL